MLQGPSFPQRQICVLPASHFLFADGFTANVSMVPQRPLNLFSICRHPTIYLVVIAALYLQTVPLVPPLCVAYQDDGDELLLHG